MAKMILSSCDFRNSESAKCIYDHLPLPVDQCKVLYFPNEKATEGAIKSKKFHQRLSEFGFSKENIYVFNYFSPAEFDVNTHIDVIYISGGNTFGTMKRIKESGAETIILDCISHGAMYIGGSAGAHIASRSIHHVAKYDHDTYGLTDFSGLCLLDGVLICHYSNLREKDYIALIEAGEQNVIKLQDQDYIVFDI
ncbi:MAG: hypothetical protein E7655_07880 [Ruminococcaceae bacterium]|nr:hypothetical protein [Oscillospiraceae bacterium]